MEGLDKVFTNKEMAGCQVQASIFGLGLYASLIGIVIGVFSNFHHSRLKPFRHEGNSQYRSVSVSKRFNFQ